MAIDKNNDKNAPKRGGTPIFAGKTALIKFINPNDPDSATIWFADNTNKTIRPFVSGALFDQMFDNPVEAQKAVVTLSSDELGPDGIFKDFQVLGDDFAIGADGAMKPVEFSNFQIQKRYGEPVNEDGEAKSMQVLDGIFSSLSGKGTVAEPPVSPNEPPMVPPEGLGGIGSGAVSDEASFYDGFGGYDGVGAEAGNMPMYGYSGSRLSGMESYWDKAIRNVADLAKISNEKGLTPNFLDSVKNDASLMGFYIGALTYGGYEVADIYADIIRRSQPNAGSDTTFFISPTTKREVFYSSPEGKKASERANELLGGEAFDTSKLKYSVYNMPADLFKVLVPIKEVGTPEFEAEADKIVTAYYDVLMEKASAVTDQEKAVADYNEDTLKKELEKSYGIVLSDNSEEAWRQIQSLAESMDQRGIQGSGIHSEARDEILRRTRQLNQRQRDEKVTKEEESKKTYYTSFASPDQIQALINEDRSKGLPKSEWRATKWGLVPSDEIMNEMSFSNLKAKYPNMTDEEINKLRETVFDQNGNLRSNLYERKYQAIYDKETGIMAKKRAAQEEEVLRQSQMDQYRAYLETAIPSDQDKFSSWLQEEKNAQYQKGQNAPIAGAQTPTTPITTTTTPKGTTTFTPEKGKVYTEADFQTKESQLAALKYMQDALAGLAKQTNIPQTTTAKTTTTTPVNPVVAPVYPAISFNTASGNKITTPTISTQTQTSTPAFTPNSTGYSFNKLPTGAVEIYKNGQGFSTGTASAATDYGYKL